MSFNCDVFFMLSLGRGIIYWKKKNHPIGGRKENVVIVVDWKFIFGFLYWPQNKLVVVQLKERSVNPYKWRYKEFWKKKKKNPHCDDSKSWKQLFYALTLWVLWTLCYPYLSFLTHLTPLAPLQPMIKT